jgi:phosphoglycerate dehydrogenase-like enzyme
VKPVALYYRALKYQAQNIRRLDAEFNLITLDDPSHDTAEILAGVEVLFAPLGYLTDKRKIDLCPRLRVIVSNTTGHPHIDVDYAHSRGIYVACLKFAQEFLRTITPTAELTWGLIIALTRNIIPAQRAVLGGVWDRRPFPGQAMLSTMTLGIVGYGRIGRMVAHYGRAFGMTVRYHDPFVAGSAEGGQSVARLHDLVAQSDIVSVHVPHEKTTELMFSSGVFESFKRGAYFINTARGELVDWAALLNALETGLLGGAALDVFEGEYAPGFASCFPSHPVLQYARNHSNLLLTPHIGGSTIDAWTMTEAHAIDMALEHLKGTRGHAYS